jgi:valyl-tRNA synthetase
MDKVYNPAEIEKKWVDKWEKEQTYSPTLLDSNKENFSILLPPPNANASLHAGHAMFVVQDILIRFYRMLGYNSLWIPGTDHAGFETQYVFEKALAKQGKSRFDFNRDDFYDAVARFVDDNSGLIEEQLKQLGFSLDWSRKTFTLDQRVVERVYKTFAQMHEDGLLYRDNYIVNYCTHCGTTFSELETEYVEREDPFVYMKYGPFVLGTVRPETKFGDTAVAVHPKDKRYAKYIGKMVEFEGLNGKVSLKVIADEYVDREFGTGVVKVTPAHDPNDFAMGQRHGLEVQQVIGLNGRLNENCGKYAGMKVKAAREQVIKDMEERGLVEKIDSKYTHRVAVCYKCSRDIEPMVLPNWFIKMRPLADKGLQVVREGHVKFYPKRFENEYNRWLENIRDWPVSRQVVWGIRIPAWYDIKQNPQMYVTFLDQNKTLVKGQLSELMSEKLEFNGAKRELEDEVHAKVAKYSYEEIRDGLQRLDAPSDAKFVISPSAPADGKDYLQETDTFDTWFSSGHWPLVTLDFPEGDDFKKLYPTAVLDTMWDILPFWVARMIMLCVYVTQRERPELALEDAVPFRQVLLHSRVVDAKGKKMSKSKGNVVNPLRLTQKYGTDALRMALIAGSALGNDVPLVEEKVKGYRNFTNKIWNSARFVMEFKPDGVRGLESYKEIAATPLIVALDESKADAGEYTQRIIKAIAKDEASASIVKELVRVSIEAKSGIQRYRFSDVALMIQEFYWHDFCDKYIEYAKDKREDSQAVLEFVLKTSMELLEPFMPFVTNEIIGILQRSIK